MATEPDDPTGAEMYARYHTTNRRPDVDDSLVLALSAATYARTVLPHLPTDPDTRILDAGCGEGTLLRHLAARGYRKLSGFDLSPENVEICRTHGLAQVQRLDVAAVNDFEPGRQYDVVLGIDTLEHYQRTRAHELLDGLRRRLAPGGRLIVQTPNLGSLLGTNARYSDLTHTFGVTEKSVVDLLTLAGFDRGQVEVHPCWSATTRLGRAREQYLRVLHRLVFLADGSGRPRIPTANLIAVARA